MTPAPDSIRVQREMWDNVTQLAEEMGSTPEVFVEESYLVMLLAARTMLANRMAKKEQTYVLVGKLGSTFRVEDDLEIVLRELASDPGNNAEPEVASVGIIDPFASDELVTVSVPPDVLGGVIEASRLLGLEAPILEQAGINLRHLLHIAHRNRDVVLLDTANPMHFTQLPMQFAE